MSGTRPTEEEIVSRQVNEAIERGLWPGDDEKTLRIRCECGRIECNAFVEMRVDAYEQLRANPRWFVICEGHEIPAIEQVVAKKPGYLVVEKQGSAGREAEHSDPRDESADDEPVS